MAKGWAHILAPPLVKSTAFANYFFSWNLDFSHGLHVETQKGVLYKFLGLLWGIKDMIHVDQVWHVSGTCYSNQRVLSLCWIEQSFYYNLTFMKVLTKSCGEISLGNNKLKDLYVDCKSPGIFQFPRMYHKLWEVKQICKALQFYSKSLSN